MSRREESRGHSVTDTASTLSTDDATKPGRKIPALAVVVEADRVDAGAWVVSLDGASSVSLARGKERRAERDGDELVVALPDRRMSKPHARIELAPGGATLRDVGSSNGTFVLGPGGEERATAGFVAWERVFRVGHTFATLLPDAGILIERARTQAPWPFTTLSASFARDLFKLERVAGSMLPIMLLGETGSGKEILARAIHDRSLRPGRMVAVNCGALPTNLVEAHLFGHQKGSFSGAVKDEVGYVRSAHGGTLFLDEIGDLPLTAQVSLLRVLQEREVTPVGAFEPVKVDVRVISATHKDLSLAVSRGEFRADLFARLSGFAFGVPPLRERVTDLGALLAELRSPGAVPVTLRPDAVAAMLRYDYPMNVRELRHAVDSAMVLGEKGTIRAEDLPARMRDFEPLAPSEADAALKQELEKHLIEHGGNLSQVAREMGKARQQVQRWVKRFGLKT
jgi:transcriptional regulator of acetoin/glycerol metabolism